jgi:hypothetical protein
MSTKTQVSQDVTPPNVLTGFLWQKHAIHTLVKRKLLGQFQEYHCFWDAPEQPMGWQHGPLSVYAECRANLRAPPIEDVLYGSASGNSTAWAAKLSIQFLGVPQSGYQMGVDKYSLSARHSMLKSNYRLTLL